MACQQIATVETNSMFYQNSATTFGLAKSKQNYNLYTISQNRRWKWSASPSPPLQFFQRSLVIWGGGHSTSAFDSVKVCVMINFSLRHNVLCFSFVVVLHSMYIAYMQLLKWFSLMKEIVMCNNNLRLKSPLTRSTDH